MLFNVSLWTLLDRRHPYNNQQFAFVSVNGFEITNQTVLECPVFKLQSVNR
uniref:Uncharacterized protein n=1 Tax=Rhizophagus irregularis (strain DAOM 181602 / DAOM 197198 / MUCL 43194) TaxID=747089 RepID=U9UTB2_RHIID